MKVILQLVCWFNRKAKNFAIRLVKWTGKSKEYTHPKHLIHDDDHYWFKSFLRPDDTLLDLGCGDGSHTLVSADYVAKIAAADHSARNLEIAKRKAAAMGKSNVEFRISDLEKPLDFPAQSFSVVLALDILEHLYNRDQFMAEIYRILKPNGRLILSIPNRDTGWKKLLKRYGIFFYSDLDHKYEYEKDEVLQLMEKNRFKVQSFDPTVLDTPWVGLIDVIGGLSLATYGQLSKWKRSAAIRHPEEATGFRLVAEKQ